MVRLSAPHSAEVTRSALSGSTCPVRRSFTCRTYWRKPVVSVAYARRWSSSLTWTMPMLRNGRPLAISFWSSMTNSGALSLKDPSDAAAFRQRIGYCLPSSVRE